MKVFLSWSGDRSKAVAELLDEWIQCVLQPVRPWMSARGIDRGALWFTEIADQLRDVTIGIVCLTKENRERPWILFEAGALARGLSSQRVITFLIELAPTEIADPLAQFNHTLPNKDGLWKLVATVNSRLGERALGEKILGKVFETYWPQFEESYAKILKDTKENAKVPARSEESKMDEMLSFVRGIDRRIRELETSAAAPPARTSDLGDCGPSATWEYAVHLAKALFESGMDSRDIDMELRKHGIDSAKAREARFIAKRSLQISRNENGVKL